MRKLGNIAVFVLAALYWLMAVSAASRHSATFDEPLHFTGGYSYWLRNDVRLIMDAGQLPQRIAAFPLLFMRPKFPPESDPAWINSDSGDLGKKFLYRLGNDPQRLLMAGRMMIALLGAALVVLVYEWSRSLFGRAGGLVSAGLCAFCPAMLAHGALVTSDMTVTFFFTFAIWTAWRLLHRVSPGRLAVCGIALSGLALSKMSAAIFVPTVLGFIIFRLCKNETLPVHFRTQRTVTNRGAQLLIFTGAGAMLILLVAAAIWACYGFHFELRNPGPPVQAYAWPPPAECNTLPLQVLNFMRDHRLLPEPFLQGFATMLRGAAVRRCFLDGRYGAQGFPDFFPYAFLVKTPIALLLLLGVAAIAIYRQAGAKSRLYAIAPLLWFVAVYWAFAIASHLNIGHRHILPVYPPLYIIAGAASFFLVQGTWWQRWLTGGLLLWFTGASLWIRPNYLAYFNELTGGPRQGYRHLVDSSLDWGQDLPGLKVWLDDHRLNSPDRVYLSYFGTASPDWYGFKTTQLPYRNNDDIGGLKPFTGGVYCISATKLQMVYSPAMGDWCAPYEKLYRKMLPEMRHLGEFSPAQLPPDKRQALGTRISIFEELRFGRLCAYLRQREPDEEIGYSILIYHLTDAEVNEALYGKPAELFPDVTVQTRR